MNQAGTEPRGILVLNYAAGNTHAHESARRNCEIVRRELGAAWIYMLAPRTGVFESVECVRFDSGRVDVPKRGAMPITTNAAPQSGRRGDSIPVERNGVEVGRAVFTGRHKTEGPGENVDVARFKVYRAADGFNPRDLIVNIAEQDCWPLFRLDLDRIDGEQYLPPPKPHAHTAVEDSQPVTCPICRGAECVFDLPNRMYRCCTCRSAWDCKTGIIVIRGTPPATDESHHVVLGGEG